MFFPLYKTENIYKVFVILHSSIKNYYEMCVCVYVCAGVRAHMCKINSKNIRANPFERRFFNAFL